MTTILSITNLGSNNYSVAWSGPVTVTRDDEPWSGLLFYCPADDVWYEGQATTTGTMTSTIFNVAGASDDCNVAIIARTGGIVHASPAIQAATPTTAI